MGLDMNAFTTSEQVDAEIDFQVQDSSELMYWRKHHDLHGWMNALYIKKGGSEDTSDFNCVNLKLNLEDLLQLRSDLVSSKLPATTGFFFGSGEPSEEQLQEDLKFVENAISAIEDGQTVYYSSWW